MIHLSLPRNSISSFLFVTVHSFVSRRNQLFENITGKTPVHVDSNIFPRRDLQYFDMSSNIASPNRETQGPVDQNDREAMAPSRVLQGLPYVHVDSKPSPSGTLPTSAPGLNVEGPGDKERVGSGHSTINGDTEVEVLSASYIRPQSRTRRALLVSILAFTCFLSVCPRYSILLQ